MAKKRKVIRNKAREVIRGKRPYKFNILNNSIKID
jgi:hypothetical protein